MEVMTITGHAYSAFVEGKGYGWSREDLDSEKTKRTKDGKLRRDKIGTKRKLSLKLMHMTRAQLAEAYRTLMLKGAKHFGLHAFLASNTLTNAYYPTLARILFETAVELHRETGAHIAFINLSGGVGVAYRPEDPDNDIMAIGEGVRKAYEEVLVPAGMGDVRICTELGRFMLGPMVRW